MVETIIITNKDNAQKVVEESNASGQVLLAQQIEGKDNTIKVKNKNKIKVITSNTRGIGINRNIGLYYSSADICVLADDDVTFYDGYENKIISSYEKFPDADIIIFDIDKKKSGEFTDSKQRPKRVRWYNYMRYGAARYTFRRESILKHSINFNTYFGASVYGSGEDTLFLKSALEKKLKIYYVPMVISHLRNDRKSTWFTEYNLKYFKDKGALFYAINPKFHHFLSARYIIKMKISHKISYSFFQLYNASLEGASSFKKIK